jgi:hypothetical protein
VNFFRSCRSFVSDQSWVYLPIVFPSNCCLKWRLWAHWVYYSFCFERFSATWWPLLRCPRFLWFWSFPRIIDTAKQAMPLNACKNDPAISWFQTTTEGKISHTCYTSGNQQTVMSAVKCRQDSQRAIQQYELNTSVLWKFSASSLQYREGYHRISEDIRGWQGNMSMQDPRSLRTVWNLDEIVRMWWDNRNYQYITALQLPWNVGKNLRGQSEDVDLHCFEFLQIPWNACQNLRWWKEKLNFPHLRVSFPCEMSTRLAEDINKM